MSNSNNPLEMSDEDILNMPLPTDVDEEEEELDNSEELDDDSSNDNELDDESTEEEDLADENASEELSDDEAEDDEDDSSDNEEENIHDDDSDDTDSEETDETSATNYEELYKKVVAPFKANGHEIKVDSPEEVIQLMQMGANYNKKMAGLKPNLKIMKMLQNNDLLDEGKLNTLIDLSKKDPKAIAKLIKDAGIDPLDLDTDKDSDYTPNTYNVSDSEVELDSILEDIRDTETYNRTLDIVGNKWDRTSKEILSSNPGIIKVINDQVANGIYDQITAVVEKERMLGKLTGVSDLDAYKQVGDALQAQGAFTQRNSSANDNAQKQVKVQKESKLKSRKRAASPTRKAAPSKKVAKDFNPLELDDAEFEKMISGKLM